MIMASPQIAPFGSWISPITADAILAGAKDYIIKPFQTDEVMKVMEQACADAGEIRMSGGAA